MGVSNGATVAHQKLAKLMKRELEVDIDPRMLRLFLLAHWSKVQGLAHAIHDNAGDMSWARDEMKAIA